MNIEPFAQCWQCHKVQEAMYHVEMKRKKRIEICSPDCYNKFFEKIRSIVNLPKDLVRKRKFRIIKTNRKRYEASCQY